MNMNANSSVPSSYLYEESFAYLAPGDQFVMDMLSLRGEAVELATGVINSLDKLNKLLPRECPIQGVVYELLADDVISPFKHSSLSPLSRKDGVVKSIDSRFWGQLLERSKLTTLLNTKDKEAIRAESKTDAPQFVSQAVMTTLQASYENRFKTFVNGVFELFTSLSSSYKSNDKICLRKKIIIPEAFSGLSWNHHSSGRDRLFDLERVFTILDCKDPTIISYSSSLPSKLEEAVKDGLSDLKNDYFECTVYGCGNIHVTFLRVDLVERFNGVLEGVRGGDLGFRSAVR
jgi:hypothetical protein